MVAVPKLEGLGQAKTHNGGEKKFLPTKTLLSLLALPAVAVACVPQSAPENPTVPPTKIPTENAPTPTILESPTFPELDVIRQKVIELARGVNGVSVLDSTNLDQLPEDQKTTLQQFQDSQRADVDIMAQNTPGTNIVLANTQIISAFTDKAGLFEVGFSTLDYNNISDGSFIGNALTYQFKNSDENVVNAALIQDQEQIVDGKTIKRYLALPNTGGVAFPAIIAVYDNPTDISPSQVYILQPDGSTNFKVMPLQGDGSDIETFSGQVKNISFKIEKPVPMIEVGGLQLQDPKVSNPELFNLTSPDSPIVQFANAFGVKPEEVGDLTPVVWPGADGKKFVVLTTGDLAATEGFDESGTPLLIAVQEENGEWRWRKPWPRMMADANELTLEVPMIASDKNVDKIANQIFLSGELDASIVFKYFTKNNWDKIISNWSVIQAQLDDGKIPEGFAYNWSSANEAIDYANTHNMTVRAQHLLWGGDVPDSIYNGNYTKEEIKMIAEFIVKTRVLQYNGIIDMKDKSKDPERKVIQWDVADEWGATKTYPHDKWSFWLDNLGFPNAISDVSKWVTDANPDAEQVIIEDGMLHLPSDRNNWKSNFMNLLNFVLQNKIPIKRVGIENNFTVFNPPSASGQVAFLKTIMDMGFSVTSETTVVSGDPLAIWFYTPTQTPSQPLISQAEIYGDNLFAYLSLGADQYGLGSISNQSEWWKRAGVPNANSSILDNDYQPTPSFYRLMQILYNNLQ